MELTAAQLYRACGALLARAAGDARDAPFELAGARCQGRHRRRRQPPPAQTLGMRPRKTRLCDQWASAPGIKDVGIQTSRALSTAAHRGIRRQPPARRRRRCTTRRAKALATAR
jgi:hypothetical protein